MATTNYIENMKRTLTIVILLFCFIGVNAQRLGKINERLENLEKNRKIEHFRKKVAKSLAVSRILLTFAGRVGADGKERLR